MRFLTGARAMEYASWTVLVLMVVGVGAAGLLSGCAHLIPTGRVVDEERFLGPPEAPPPSGEEPAVDFPVLPFAMWGLHFDEEVLFEMLDHPSFRMVEVVRLEIDGREVWFALDSHRCGRQWVGAREEFLPYARGFPAPSYRTDLDATRTETESTIRYQASWTMVNGDRVAVDAEVRKPLGTLPLRNGNGMNHSQETALAILDLEFIRSAAATVTVNDRPMRLARLSKGMLVQGAGGVMEGELTLRGTAGGALEVTLAGDAPRTFERRATEDGFVLVADGPLGTEHWRFIAGEGTQHVVETWRVQADREVFRMRFNPPLPDLRRPVEGEWRGRVVASVNGRPGYMKGHVLVSPGGEEGTTVVQVLPRAPRWARQRPARATIRAAADGSVVVDTVIEPTAPWSFGDVPCPD